MTGATMVEAFALIFFVLGYILISFERKFRTSKSAISLIMGVALWLLVVLSHKSRAFLSAAFQVTGSEIFGIIMFLLASMALVEIISRHHLFDVIRQSLTRLNVSVHRQFIYIMLFTFFLSALLDNMTVGIIMIAVIKQFFKGKNLLVVAAGLVIASNAGGSWSPIGDVTTVLLWLAGKYNALTIVREGFLPAAVFMAVACGFLFFKLESKKEKPRVESLIVMSRRDKFISGSAIISFLMPIFANAIGLPPYLGLLFGLGIIWSFLQFENTKNGKTNDTMEGIFKKLDIASVNFYAGILLAANALYALGVLEYFSKILFGATQEVGHVIWGAIAAGATFSIFDNIPLTAVSLKLINLPQQSLWVLLALTIGNGGSVLIIGSAAGIAVMSGLKDLTMGAFLKIATLPALLAYVAMVATWFVEYHFIH